MDDARAEGDDPGIGAQLGPFHVGRRLGIGGMGMVFQALDTQLNRQVALKVITPHIGEDPEFRARFTREAQAQASLDSPHVVQVYSFGEADGRLYIASQLIPDGDLGQMLHRHGRPPARIALNLIAQVADGLADAHAAGLVHRDIKPANVLLRHRDHQLHAYLGDFGIARRVGAESGLTQAGGTVGTPSYMAPELHLGGESGRASDLYSLGCLLWAALSGSAPYAGGTDYQTVMGHVERPVPQLAETGPLAAEINRVLRTAMAKQPEQRYPSAAAMRDDLRAVVRLPDDAVPVRPADDVPVPQPTNPAWAFAPPPTPTPTPTPSAPPSAPPAPMFRSSGPTQSPYPAATFASPGPDRGEGPRKHGKGAWAIAALVVLLLVGGAVLAAVLIAGGDDSGPSGAEGGGSAGGDPTSSTSDGPTDGPTDGPSDGSTDGPSDGPSEAADLSGEREQKAVAALSGAFAADGTADASAADCFARQFVARLGVDKLVETGILDDDLAFVGDSSTNPQAGLTLLSTLGEVSQACLSELTGPTS